MYMKRKQERTAEHVM